MKVKEMKLFVENIKDFIFYTKIIKNNITRYIYKKNITDITQLYLIFFQINTSSEIF